MYLRLTKVPERFYNFSLAFLLSLLLPINLLAQPGLNEFNKASNDMHNWYFSMSDLVLVIGALAGICGGLRLYTNWQLGKAHHIDAQVIGWFLSSIFLTLLGTFLKYLYGIR